MYVGLGVDVHRMVKGRKLILGGVTIPFEKGLLGHSDADVLIHALCDAILGAAGLGDIGMHFPDTNPEYKDISSMILLSRVFKMITRKGHTIENIDLTVIAEAPRLSAYKDDMCKNIAQIIEIDPIRVNIKATTTEGLGMMGKGEGIAAMGVVILI
ncbi:2-C-methyl-D-erythritol 2,4-cyclodiphosphate synthase [Thermodesulfobacteriota bacterium]